MASKEELEKMTVAQIKEKLKGRKLPTSGAKSDLVNRLFESIMTEENLLDETGGENIDLSNVNMDEVLGLDDEKDSHSVASSEQASEVKQNDSLLSIGSITVNESTDGERTAITSPAKKAQQNQNAASKAGSSIASNNPDKHGQKTVETGGADKKIPMDGDKKVQLKTAARLGVPLAESEAKEKRAARFGAAAETGDEEAKAKQRAIRFGTVAEEAKRKTPTDEDGKMLKRAERFGLPLKRGAESASGVDTSAGTASDEKRAKRAERFGIAAVATGGDSDLKKVARAKRFGMAS